MVADGFTIGEVLNQLKEDFEDITISKIRFLESEGLIYPDRTESGYRKFTDDDVDRLRFILTAQRDHYLPLKVIRDQLERLDTGRTPAAAGSATDNGGDGAAAPGGVRQAVDLAAAWEAAAARSEPLLLDESGPPVTLSLREFVEATGLEQAEIRALRDYGILGGGPGDEIAFDAEDVLAGRAARELLRIGLEPRHLRMYRQFVDRELALFEQLITPLLRQRNPEARRQAMRQLEKLGLHTHRMKRSLLARTLRSYVSRA